MRFISNIFILILLIVFNGYSAVIINHTSVAEFDAITQQQADSVRQMNILFSHRSTGRIIMYGLQELGSQNVKYVLNFIPATDDYTTDVTLSDYITHGPIFGHQNQAADHLEEFFDFAEQNDNILDVGIVKRCFVDMYSPRTAQSLFNDYKAYVDAFKTQDRDIVLVHCTMPLTSDTDGINAERSKYRDLILAEYGSSGDYIYDIADIESWYNNAYTTFEYNSTNYLRMYPSYTSDEGHPNALGRVPLAKAMWVMLAKIAQSSSAGIESTPGIPNKSQLYQNYPNPFNPATTFSFELSKPEQVRLEIYNVNGQKVETVLDQKMPAGLQQVDFTAGNLASGVYLYQLTAGDYQAVKKMILIK
jgi:hypothetical protein